MLPPPFEIAEGPRIPFSFVGMPVYQDKEGMPGIFSTKGRCYQEANTFQCCKARAYETEQCRKPLEDWKECLWAQKKFLYLTKVERWIRDTSWDEVREFVEYTDSVTDRVLNDQRPLAQRVRENAEHFDFETGKLDVDGYKKKLWGEGGTWQKPTDRTSGEQIHQPFPGWGIHKYKQWLPHPDEDRRTLIDRILGRDPKNYDYIKLTKNWKV
eukprot:NODE_4034_length_848_cov_25.909887_g3343_i0.p1 GENE.NODE_4034_length_848_cov_25.909887_g3343_i0~~NODE_4034_length_848_cov_25.909887_g3343_i0.p1  ORF type:complete len:212 (+),score=39.84 NODE_4034_length_848_cov_25.909887_g3343_i0:143-778(+)